MTCIHNKEHCRECNEYLCFDDYAPELYRDKQVGGSHYADCAIQPADYAIANGFNYYECIVLRYITRHRNKGGRQDLEKAIHCLQLMIENEYAEKSAVEFGSKEWARRAMQEMRGVVSVSELEAHANKQEKKVDMQGVSSEEPGVED